MMNILWLIFFLHQKNKPLQPWKKLHCRIFIICFCIFENPKLESMLQKSNETCFFEKHHWRNPLYFTAYFFDTHNPSLCNYLMKRNSCYPTNLIIIHHAQKTWWYDKQTRKPNNKTILVTWKTNHNLNSLPCIIVSNPVPLVSIWCAYKTVTFSPKFHIFTFHFQL